jgi:hypothetical protein
MRVYVCALMQLKRIEQQRVWDGTAELTVWICV